ncbi:2-aminomuconic semialdehyde dehydrogenase [Patella vulgata]|uniref:2-aminomuconic semialdehyde dehydrogenase n=1 Tax=Patella vulgata TaxID=6465 RepID=UPI0024A7A619|nr:2-aminomuconic semialdehyde dehydrogenase [Patella vulgata]
MIVLEVENFINGKFVPSESHIDSYEPSTGEVWASIPDSGEKEIELAVASAKAAFKGWSSTPREERSRLINKVADLLEKDLEKFAEMEARDQGKPLRLARLIDIPRAIYNLRFFASAILHDLNSSTVLEKAGAINYTIKHPVGVAGLISPWNLPLYLLTFKLAPAIAAGNTVVAKPSEMTSVTAYKLCELFNEAGFPPGVVNMVFGFGHKAGEALVSHADVPLISFTGGTVTAEKVRMSASKHCKKLSLELGGKNAAVVFKDAELDKCVSQCIKSSFMNQGEICLCTSRIFVQRQLFPHFLELFVQATRKLTVGNPYDETAIIGALISNQHLNKVKGYVKMAEKEEADVLCGDMSDGLNLTDEKKNGYFMRPTVITNVRDESRLMTEEIFGPVVCVVPFDDEDEVIERVNKVKYGLCATVWTQDVSRLHRVSHQLQVGTVWANCWLVRDLNLPFGGVKESGVGREGLKDSIDFYTEEKTICLQL